MIRPKQKLSRKEKTVKWVEDNLKYNSRSTIMGVVDREHFNHLYALAAGTLKNTAYTHVTNPLNSDKYRTYPEKIKNYNIITPIFMQLLGEFIKRPIEPVVIAKNSDLENQQAELEYSLILQSLQQQFVNLLIQKGQYVEGQTDENGQPTQPPLSPEYIKKQKQSLKDLKAISGQRILEYVISEQELLRKWREMFYDFIVTKSTFSYKDVSVDNVFYTRIRPQNIFYYATDNVDYIEDAEIVRYINFYTISEIIDLFKDEPDFTPEMIEALEDRETGMWEGGFLYNWNKNYSSNNSLPFVDALRVNSIPVEHIQWTSMAKVYRIYTIDVFNNPVYYDVDEDYIFNEGEKVEEKWIKEKWEGYIIAGKYYIGGKPIDLQRGTFDNPNKCKNSYNGRIYMNQFKDVKSITETLEPYQEAYNILKWKIQSMINKNKDKLMVIPLGLLGHFKENKKKVDFDGNEYTVEDTEESVIEKAMYYADALSTLFVDETEENAQLAAQMIKSIDMSLGNYIQYLYNYATQVKAEAEEQVGFNRYRKAATNSSDAVSNVNQGVYAGSLITEEYFTEFNEFIERECQGIVDISKFAYRNGKKTKYLRTDGELIQLNLEEGSIQDTEFGVFTKNGGKTKEDLEILKQRTLEFAQNGMKQSIIAKIVNSSSNFASLIEEIEAMEEQMMQQQQQAQQQEQQMMQMQIEAKQVEQKAELDKEYYKIDKDSQTKLEVKYAELSAKALELNQNDDYIKLQELKQKQMDSMIAQQMKMIEFRLKDKQIESDEKIAKMNKN
jgi:hypothetical protein